MKLIATSHSSMGTYETCPRQYEAKYITKDVKFESGPEAEWGTAVHEALEFNIREGKPLPGNMVQYQRYADAVRNRPGEKFLEGAFAVDADLKPTDFFADNVWWRSKIDVLIVKPDGIHAELLDFKTGKNKPDTVQLMLYACLVFFHFPDIQEIKGGYIWLKDGVVTPPITYLRTDLPTMWAMFVRKYQRLHEANEAGVFLPKPSGLCNGWCPVKRCEFWRPRPPGR